MVAADQFLWLSLMAFTGATVLSYYGILVLVRVRIKS